MTIIAETHSPNILPPAPPKKSGEGGFDGQQRRQGPVMENVPMRAEGYEKLTAELKILRAERPRIVDAIEEARAHGDLSENAEYHAAKERQGQGEETIADLEDRLSRAMVIDPTTLSGDKIVFGATVTLIDEDEKKVKYQLVGQVEADANQGRISYNSPLGRALIGRHKGEEVEVST